MKFLSFDTSGQEVQVAAFENNLVVCEKIIQPSHNSRQDSATKLLPTINAIFEELAWQKKELDYIVVGIGPGSFTGVRVAVITARTMGQGLNLGVIPVSTLESLALLKRNFVNSCDSADLLISDPVAIILNAGSQQCYFAILENNFSYSQKLKNKPSSFSDFSLNHFILGPKCIAISEISKEFENCSNLDLDKTHIIYDKNLDPENFKPENFKPENINPFDLSEINLARLAGELICKNFVFISGQVEFEFESDLAANKNLKLLLSKTYTWDNIYPMYLRNPSVTLAKTKQI